MNVELDKLRALFELLHAEDIAEFEHEKEGVRLRIVRARGQAQASQPLGAAFLAAELQRGGLHSGTSAGSGSERPPQDDAAEITSPFVGTFYRAATPDAPAFVEVGSVVRAGQTLCIIEAMKLMNEIEAEWSGTVVEIFPQNGKSVEFGQRLFRVKKA